ncbi:MAG: aminotransferase class I/II-fold pyridoxal phosphate-dependent enzyme, partial [Alphaproteobacteria bacterium]
MPARKHSSAFMLNDRLEQLTDYPFERLRSLLDGICPPASVDPVHMHFGEPKHEPPGFIAPTLTKHAAEWGRYPPIAGTSELRAAIARWLVRRYGLPEGWLDADDQVLPVVGTREALFMAALVAVPRRLSAGRPAVLMPNPLYHVYFGAAIASGAEPVMLPATRENGFQPDLRQLPAAVLDRAALAYINSPANPQGSVADREKLAGAIALARAHDFVLAVDECYAEIYTAEAPPGALEVCARMGGGSDNVLVFHSLSKRSNVPGLRSGFVAGDRRLVRSFVQLRQYAGATMPMPIMAASTRLWRDEAHVDANRELYRQKFDVALDILDGALGAERPGGGFFLWLEVGDG